MADDRASEKSGLLAAQSGKVVASTYQSHDDLSEDGKAARQLHHSASCGGACGSVQHMDYQEANGEQMLKRSSSSSGRLQRMDSARTLVRGSSMTFARQADPGKDSACGDGGLTPHLCLAVVVVSLGSSLQFGYGTGVMNNSEAFIRGSFEAEGKPYTLHMWAATVSMFGWGGLVGAMAGTKILSRWWGRKTILQATTLLVFLSSALLAFGPEWYYLTAGRFLVGVVAGVATGVVPTYLSEISPISLRGGIGTAHQLGITLGILLSETLSTPSLHLLGSMSLWQWLFAPPSVLALLQLVFMPFIPESPAYLYVNEGEEVARAALRLLRGEGAQAEREVDASLLLIEEEVSMQDQEEADTEQSQYTVMHLLRDRTVRKQLVVGVVVQLMMQLSGIDAVFYYSTDVFKLAGVQDPQLATTLLGTVNVLVTLWALKYMDVAGRRTLLLASWAGMFSSYILLTLSLVTLASPTLDPSLVAVYEHLSVISMTGVIIFFAFGPGCIAWLIISEIFPLHARESAMFLGMSINWVANWAVAFSFPVLLHVAREWAFLLFIATTSTFFFFTLCFVPETKNRSVPEITRIFQAMPMPFVGAQDPPTLPK